MKLLTSGLLSALVLLLFSQNTLAFTAKISGDGGALGEQASSQDCKAQEEEAFTGAASNSVYSSEQAYSGSRSIKMTIEEGLTGFGSFGGILSFSNCEHIGGRSLVKGDEIWIRTRLFFPIGWEFNQGSNKFMRLRTYNMIDGKEVSEGYNDLYIRGHPEDEDFRPFRFIFEGEQLWYTAGTIDDYFEFGKWKTVELYLKLDNIKESQGGDARVRIWVDGKLIADTGERITLKTSTSYVKYFSLFTWFGNEGAPKTQSVFLDDFVLTTDTPEATDGAGNHYIGLGEPATITSPNPPSNFTIK